jgi:hypothetical protein
MSKKVTPLGAAQANTEPPGKTVFVCASKFSKAFTAHAALAFKKGLVKSASQIVLPDGQVITAGPTYETTMSTDLIELIKAGVLQASAFGKLKGGKTCLERKDTSTIPPPP